MKKQKFLQVIQTTATLMCCALLIIGNLSPIPNPDDDNEGPIIEIENPIPEENGDGQYDPQDDYYPLDDEGD